MNDSPRPRSAARAGLRRLFRWLRHPFSTALSARREQLADLLRQALQIQTLEELLERFPEQLCEALSLSAFDVFLLEQGSAGQARGSRAEYCLKSTTPMDPALPRCIDGSSAVIARLKRERAPSFFAAGAADGSPEPWQQLATAEEVALLSALNTQVLVPLAGRMRMAGFVALARTDRRPFSRSEKRFLRDLGPRMGRGLETAMLLETLSLQAVARDRARRELLLAREVQEHLLPAMLPSLAGVDLASSYRSAAEVGGDYFDAFLNGAGELYVMIADVSGKGVPAALLMSALRASVHALVLEDGVPLAGLAGRLNKLLFAASTANRYATAFFALYRPATEMLHFCNAGHNPPALLCPDGSLQRLQEGGPVLGLLRDTAFQTGTAPFPPGSTLVLYTDGITETTDAQGREWEEAGIHAVLRAAPVGSAADMLRQIQAALDRHGVAGAPLADDQTLVVLQTQARRA